MFRGSMMHTLRLNNVSPPRYRTDKWTPFNEIIALCGYCSRATYAGIDYKRCLEDSLKLGNVRSVGKVWIWEHGNDLVDFCLYDSGGTVIGPDVMISTDNRVAMGWSHVVNDF